MKWSQFFLLLLFLLGLFAISQFELFGPKVSSQSDKTIEGIEQKLRAIDKNLSRFLDTSSLTSIPSDSTVKLSDSESSSQTLRVPEEIEKLSASLRELRISLEALSKELHSAVPANAAWGGSGGVKTLLERGDVPKNIIRLKESYRSYCVDWDSVKSFRLKSFTEIFDLFGTPDRILPQSGYVAWDYDFEDDENLEEEHLFRFCFYDGVVNWVEVSSRKKL